MQNTQPDNNLKRSILVNTVDCLCAILLIGCTTWVGLKYGSMPERIPIHYGLNGVADGYGSKSAIWTVIVFAWFEIGLVSLVEQFLKFRKARQENTPSRLRSAWHLLSTTKLAIACMFAYIAVMSVSCRNLPEWFAAIVIAVFGANYLFWTIKAIRNR